MSVAARPGWTALGSLVVEDLCSRPGRALAIALDAAGTDPANAGWHLVDAAYAALQAGEPKRALEFVERARETRTVDDRHLTAVRAWALHVDGNWYPGGVSAETQMHTDGAFVTPSRGPTETMLVEHVVAHGPPSLAPCRAVIETLVRNGAVSTAQQLGGQAIAGLHTLAQLADQVGDPSLELWCSVAAADLQERCLLGGGALLLEVRQRCTALGHAHLVALTHLVEGDWHACPGSSAEALGLDLAPQTNQQVRPGEVARAADSYLAAEAAAADLPQSRLHAALQLRFGMLARSTGDEAAQRAAARQALSTYEALGDGAGVWLAATHLLVCDLDGGAIYQHMLDLGSGWHRPRAGVIAQIADWTDESGSRSWAVGLGRLLERVAGALSMDASRWQARTAYVAALPLLGLDPSIPQLTLLTALTDLDSRDNLASRALVGLERLIMTAPRANLGAVDVMQIVEAAYVMTSAYRARSRGATAESAARGLDRLRHQLAIIHNEINSSGDLMLSAIGSVLGEQLATLDVLSPLVRGDSAHRRGATVDAVQWHEQALAASSIAGAPKHLRPLVLITAELYDEAAQVLAELEAQRLLPDEFLATLWVQAHDYARAEAALARLDATMPEPTDWRDVLTRAEVHLARNRPDQAIARAQVAAAKFERSVSALLRDPDRVAACDQPDVTALYVVQARALLNLADAHPDRRDTLVEASFAAVEHRLALSAMPAIDTAARAAEVRTWQERAAEWSLVADQALLALDTPADAYADNWLDALDRADRALATAEHALDADDPGVFLRRAAPDPPFLPARLRMTLAADTVVLTYAAVGDDLLAWAVTSSGIEVSLQTISGRRLSALVRNYHVRCSGGWGAATELTKLLIDPFVAVLRDHSRVVVVPFGILNLVPVHALTFDDQPLAMTHVVSYAPRAGLIEQHAADLDRPLDVARPLVVGDPAFDPQARPDLVRLPGARIEADAVARILGCADDDVLVRDRATEAEVDRRIEACDVLHFSTHAVLHEAAPFASSLVLAGTDELTVADLAGLQFGTALAVLSGCDTGRGAALGADLVGLTRALLRGGVRRTLVSMWPVDDEIAPLVVTRFFAGIKNRRSPAAALADAQRYVYGLTADQLRTEYVVLGGQPGNLASRSRRRAPVLPEELRDDEPLPRSLDGSAERFWASFVMVGV